MGAHGVPGTRQRQDHGAPGHQAWVKHPEPDAATGNDGGLTTAERLELAELRRENRRLNEDIKILKRAAAILATATR